MTGAQVTADAPDDALSVRIVNFSDRGGGAAVAAVRLHRALRAGGTDSRLRVAVQRSDEPGVERPRSAAARLAARARPLLAHAVTVRVADVASGPRSPAALSTGLGRELQECAADVVNLHWVCGEMLSIAEIGNLRKPLVWTLHDAWAFCGAEHLLDEAGPPRHRDGYRADNRGTSVRRFDLDRWTWGRKRRAWRRPITLVCPSEWLAREARSSMLCRDWPIEVIPNAIDTTRWRPAPRDLARDVLGLPRNATLALFGALGGTRDRNKGADLLRGALTETVRRTPGSNLQLVVFGQSAEDGEPWPLPVHYLGELHDDPALILAYSAADIAVVPSRVENLPYAAIEAQACGTPVVAFRTGGLPECVGHLDTGFLAEPNSVQDLAAGIRWMLDDPARRESLRTAARKWVIDRYDAPRIADRYLAVYRRAIAGQRN